MFECAEAATDTEGIVPSEPGKGESIEGKSVEGASGMECVESHGGNYGNNPDDSLNNDETSVQSSVDSAIQDHSIVYQIAHNTTSQRLFKSMRKTQYKKRMRISIVLNTISF